MQAPTMTRDDSVKAFQENKAYCDKFRIRLEAALSEMLIKPTNMVSNTKKEVQKMMNETNAALLKRFSVARYGPGGMKLLSRCKVSNG